MYLIIANNGVDTVRGEEMRVKSCEQKRWWRCGFDFEKRQNRTTQREPAVYNGGGGGTVGFASGASGL